MIIFSNAYMKLVERETCPLCQGTNSKTLYSQPYSNPGIQNFLTSFYGEQGEPDVTLLKDETFQIEECSECGLIFQRFIPDTLSLDTLYTKWISFDKAFKKYEQYRSVYNLDSNYTMLRDVCHFMNKRDLKCFDYGFGHAHLLKQAQIFGMDVYGVELNNIQVQRAKQLGIKIINFNDEELPKMDVIFCEQVLEHTVDPRAVMNDIVRISKKGTILHLSVPDSKNVKKALSSIEWKMINGNRASIMPFAPLEHINSFQHMSLVRLAQSYGFQKLEIGQSSLIHSFSMKPLKFVKYVAYLIKIYFKKVTSPGTTEIYFIYER